MTYCIIQYLDFVDCVKFESTKFSTKCSEMVLSLSMVQKWQKYLSSVAPSSFSCQNTVQFVVFLNTWLWPKSNMTGNVHVTLRWLLNHCREWKNKMYYIFWVCVCSCSYPACKAHGTILYCHLWHVWICHIFSHNVISGIIFGKKVLNIKYVLWFSLQLSLKHFSFWEELSMILS